MLLSGTPGAGKTTLGARFLEAGCERGERGVLFAFEESPAQVVRNLRSVGIDLQSWMAAGLLRIVAVRPAAYGLETHLARIHRAVDEFEPANVVIDPLSSLDGEDFQIKSILSRLIDEFKSREITAMMTSLTRGSFDEQAGLGVSSVIDTWLERSHLIRRSNGAWSQRYSTPRRPTHRFATTRSGSLPGRRSPPQRSNAACTMAASGHSTTVWRWRQSSWSSCSAHRTRLKASTRSSRSASLSSWAHEYGNHSHPRRFLHRRR